MDILLADFSRNMHARKARAVETEGCSCGDVMEFVLVIMGVALVVSAIRGYKAEKYARKKVFNQDLSFIDYMCTSHPIMSGCGIFLLLIIIIAIFRAIF